MNLLNVFCSSFVMFLLLSAFPAMPFAFECTVVKAGDLCFTSKDEYGHILTQASMSPILSRHILVTDKDEDNVFGYMEFEYYPRETHIPSLDVLEAHKEKLTGIRKILQASWTNAKDDISINQKKSDKKDLPYDVDRVKSAVVTVYAQSTRGQTWGSGFLISPNGYIITNAHVIAFTGEAPQIRFLNGVEKTGTLIKIDNLRDLALIKIVGDHYPYLRIGDSDRIESGDEVIAIGTPLALSNEGKVTNGKIDRKHKLAGFGRGFEFIESDILTLPGNSGGPLMNKNWRVIGVNTLFEFSILYHSRSKLLIKYLKGCASPINDTTAFIEK